MDIRDANPKDIDSEGIACGSIRHEDFVFVGRGEVPHRRLRGEPDFAYGETLYYGRAPQDCIIFGFHLEPLAKKLGVEARMDIVLNALKERGWATALVG